MLALVKCKVSAVCRGQTWKQRSSVLRGQLRLLKFIRSKCFFLPLAVWIFVSEWLKPILMNSPQRYFVLLKALFLFEEIVVLNVTRCHTTTLLKAAWFFFSSSIFCFGTIWKYCGVQLRKLQNLFSHQITFFLNFIVRYIPVTLFKAFNFFFFFAAKVAFICCCPCQLSPRNMHLFLQLPTNI